MRGEAEGWLSGADEGILGLRAFSSSSATLSGLFDFSVSVGLTCLWREDRALEGPAHRRLPNAYFIFSSVGSGQDVSSGPWLAVFITVL